MFFNLHDMKQSWLLDENLKEQYIQACKDAVATKDFEQFKKHPAVNCIVENSTEEWANKIRQGTGIPYEGMTPNEVRYHYTWLILLNLIEYPSHPRVSEIGGGYGGMCEAAFKMGYIDRPIRYMIYDIAEVSKLQRNYIDEVLLENDNNFNVYCWSGFLKDPPSHDICIAWCSWSELETEMKIQYIEKVMCYADHIFVSSNWDYEGDIELLRKYFPNLKEYTNPYLGKIIYT